MTHADAIRSIVRRHGLASRAELFADGITRPQLERDLAARRIIRVRQGWYADARTSPVLLRSARVGGRATCLTALDLLGVWTAPSDRLHVAVDAHDCQLRSPDDRHRRRSPADAAVVHWRTHPARSRLALGPVESLRDLASCVPPDLFAASVDSLLRRRPAMASRVSELGEQLPLAHRRALHRADGICESGIETIFWLRMSHLPLRRQVPIRGVGRVDFLIGDRLVVEVDGAAFHADVDHFESDRRRDAVLSILGFRVLRFSYRQVMFDGDAVARAVEAAILRRDHLSR